MNAQVKKRKGIIPLVAGISLITLGASGLMTAVVFLVVGLVFSAVFPAVFGTPLDDLRLNSDAAVCDGVLEDVIPNQSLQVNGQPTVKLEYSYDAGDGTDHGDILVTAGNPMAAWTVGSSVAVEYLPDDPSVSRIQGGKVNLAGWAGAFGFGFGVLGVLLMIPPLVLILAGIILLIVARRRARS